MVLDVGKVAEELKGGTQIQQITWWYHTILPPILNERYAYYNHTWQYLAIDVEWFKFRTPKCIPSTELCKLGRKTSNLCFERRRVVT
jgi:hypothetical protein